MAKKKNRIRERIVYHVNAGHINDHRRVSTPAHAQSAGYQDVMAADTAKGIPAVIGTGRDASAAGLPVTPRPPEMSSSRGDDNYAGMRLSESRATPAHAATSTGDHSPGSGRNPGVAVHHLDLRQSTTGVSALTTLSTVNGDNGAGDAGDRDIIFANGTANVSRFNAAGEAGSFGGMQMPGGNPSRPADHQSRGSATPANGSHGLGNACSTAPMSCKDSPLDIMKASMRRLA